MSEGKQKAFLLHFFVFFFILGFVLFCDQNVTAGGDGTHWRRLIGFMLTPECPWFLMLDVCLVTAEAAFREEVEVDQRENEEGWCVSVLRKETKRV